MPKKKRRKTKNNSNKKRDLGILLGIIFVMGVFLNHYGNAFLIPEGEQEKQELLTAYRGTLTPIYTINLTEPFIVSIGTISTSFTSEQLRNGIDLTEFIHIEENNQVVSDKSVNF